MMIISTDFLLPTGNLGKVGEARRADIIIVTKRPQQLSSTEKKKIKNTLQKLKSIYLLYQYFLQRSDKRFPEISL